MMSASCAEFRIWKPTVNVTGVAGALASTTLAPGCWATAAPGTVSYGACWSWAPERGTAGEAVGEEAVESGCAEAAPRTRNPPVLMMKASANAWKARRRRDGCTRDQVDFSVRGEFIALLQGKPPA